jgi:hypothetical protein
MAIEARIQTSFLRALAGRAARLLASVLPSAAAALCAAALLCGCSTVRPVAGSGHDLIENPGRPLWVRIPAGIGAAGGYLLAVPVSAVLLPTYAFESYVVPSSQGTVVGTDAEGEKAERPPDIYEPVVYAPYDYMGGTFAQIFGWPFERLGSLVNEPPGVTPYTVEETPDLPPRMADPRLDFGVWPPVEKSEPAGPEGRSATSEPTLPSETTPPSEPAAAP